MPLAFARSRLTGMTPDRVAASIASFDFLYLTRAGGSCGVVAPKRALRAIRACMPRSRAATCSSRLPACTGNVWVFDFRSLYPSVIRTFNIDPLSYVAKPVAGRGPDHTPGRRVPPRACHPAAPARRAVPRREAAREAGDEVASHAIKILMNSFYGVLGTPACRFYNPALANSITGSGREILLWSKRWFETAGFSVLYGDTDSLFVRSGCHRCRPPRASRASGSPPR